LSPGAWRGVWYVLGAVVAVSVGYAIGDSMPDAGNGDDHGDDDLGGVLAVICACGALVGWSVLAGLSEVLLWARRLWVRRLQRERERDVR
jgi:hypothetical protein